MIKRLVVLFVLFNIFFSSVFYVASTSYFGDDDETYLLLLKERIKRFYQVLRNNETLGVDDPVNGFEPYWVSVTSFMLMGVKVLVESGYEDILDSVDVDYMINYLASKQHSNGGFGFFSYGNESKEARIFPIANYYVARALKFWNALDRINVSLFRDFALARYDNETGGFRELNDTLSAYPLLPYLSKSFYTQFRVPNILSTFVYVSILNMTGGLNLIDVNRVLNFIYSCISLTGLFLPTPNISEIGSPFLKEGFIVDANLTTFIYTYAGVMSLYYLGAIDTLSFEERNVIAKYFISLRDDKGSLFFEFFGTDLSDPLADFVIEAFYAMNLIDVYKDWCLDVARANSRSVDLRFNDDFPIPKPVDPKNYGGKIWGWNYGYEYDGGILYALYLVDDVDYLNRLTPRAKKVRSNLFWLSVFLAVLLSPVLTFVSWRLLKRWNKL